VNYIFLYLINEKQWVKTPSNRMGKNHPCAVHKGGIITLVPYKRVSGIGTPRIWGVRGGGGEKSRKLWPKSLSKTAKMVAFALSVCKFGDHKISIKVTSIF
jgi:hypothetical protein